MTSASDLNDHIGYGLRMTSNAVSHEFARRIADEGVTVAEWVVMRVLYGVGSLSPSLLADSMGMTRGAISKLSDRLVAKGLIARDANGSDKRAHMLSLTADGRAKTPLLAAIADQNDADFFGVLSNEERADLTKLLQALIDRRQLNRKPID